MNKKEYTIEQTISVQRIKNCKNYYEILEVDKDVTEVELKKKYRKLALALHPDKNKAPGAVEAFKAVGNAFAVLSDKEKKHQYDLYGDRESQTARRTHSEDAFATYDFSRGFEADVSVDELFNLFFGNPFPTSQVYAHRNSRFRSNRYNQANVQEEPNLYSALLQMMVILLLIVLSFMSSYLSPDPPFSLLRTSKYINERVVKDYDIKYYVKDKFEVDYRDSIRRIELQVVEDYIATLKSNCHKEKNYKYSMTWRAATYRDPDLEQSAKHIKTPSCDKLAEFGKYQYGY